MTRPTFALLCLILTGGCAVNTTTGPVHDPYEDFNRAVYRFNNVLDNNILKPVARGYRYVTPDFIELGIANFFANIDDVTNVANALLQGKFKQAASDTGRVVLNTTAGIGGFFDAGTRAGLPKHNESFGQTLGYYGVGEGPFLMLPLLGPNNARTTTGLVPDSTVLSAKFYLVDDTPTNLGLTAAEVVSIRSRLLSAGNLLNTAALDPYLMLRDFWVQRDRRLTFDGQRPVAIGSPDDDFGDDFDELDDLDRLDALDDADELDELDELDRLDALDNAVEPDELDELDELDRLDALDNAAEPDELDELDELDRLDALD